MRQRVVWGLVGVVLVVAAPVACSKTKTATPTAGTQGPTTTKPQTLPAAERQAVIDNGLLTAGDLGGQYHVDPKGPLGGSLAAAETNLPPGCAELAAARNPMSSIAARSPVFTTEFRYGAAPSGAVAQSLIVVTPSRDDATKFLLAVRKANSSECLSADFSADVGAEVPELAIVQANVERATFPHVGDDTTGFLLTANGRLPVAGPLTIYQYIVFVQFNELILQFEFLSVGTKPGNVNTVLQNIERRIDQALAPLKTTTTSATTAPAAPVDPSTTAPAGAPGAAGV